MIVCYDARSCPFNIIDDQCSVHGQPKNVAVLLSRSSFQVIWKTILMFYVMVTIAWWSTLCSFKTLGRKPKRHNKVIKQSSNIYIFTCKCSAELLQASPHYVGQTFCLLYFNDNSSSNIVLWQFLQIFHSSFMVSNFPSQWQRLVVKFPSPSPPPSHRDMNKSQSWSLPLHKENKLIPFFFGGGVGKGGLLWGMLISLNDQTET